MTIKELKQRLINEKIPREAYSFNKEFPDESYCIRRKYCLWEVYYSERGLKSGLMIFSREEEACIYFYDLLINALKSEHLLREN